MFQESFICVWLLALVPGGTTVQERLKVPQGEPPIFCKVMMLGEKIVKLNGPAGASYKSDIGDLEFHDASGKKLSADDFRKRVTVGSVVVVASDEKVVDPVYAAMLKPETVVLRGVTVLVASEDHPGRGWTLDLKAMKFGDGAVDGRVMGAEFKPNKIQLLNTGLSLRTDTDNIHIFLNLKPGQGIEGESFEWKPEPQEGQVNPAVHVHMNSLKPPGIQASAKGYALRLEFGKETGGKIPSKIYLCLPDDKKSWVAGCFTIDIR